jgi:hypothetical protein
MLNITPPQPVDRTELLDLLARIEERITTVDRLIIRQRTVLARLERAGRPTDSARRILEGYVEALASHLTDHARTEDDVKRLAGSTVCFRVFTLPGSESPPMVPGSEP